MTTIEELKHKIATVDDLKSVIKTMKALAAVSIRQYEKAVESLTEYDRTLEKGWQILLKNNPELLIKKSPQTTQSWGLVVFGSDWGMCGQFNERIAEYTHDYLNSLSERPRRKTTGLPLTSSIPHDKRLILAVGTRIYDCLEAAGQKCEAAFNLPNSVFGITSIIQEIVLTLEKWRGQGQVSHIMVVYNRISSGVICRPKRLQIFPLNLNWLRKLKQAKWKSHSLPSFTMEEEKLAAALFRQYFFVSLYNACAESLKSENISRLAAMQMAEKNIAERLSELNRKFNHQRQTTITEELLDIVSGFEALNN